MTTHQIENFGKIKGFLQNLLAFNSFTLLLCQQMIKQQYRDRAAERRILHGGFGVGPGQKNHAVRDDTTSSPDDYCPEEAASEALQMSFGAGSYARKLLENMGWKEVWSQFLTIFKSNKFLFPSMKLNF